MRIAVEDVVLVKRDKKQKRKWKLGIVRELYPKKMV